MINNWSRDGGSAMNLRYLRDETVGYGSSMKGPYGKRKVTYADFTASGKQLRFIENYLAKISESYGSTHMNQTYTSRLTSDLYDHAKKLILSAVGADDDYCVIPSGTGATAAITRIAKILGIYRTPAFEKRRQTYMQMQDPADSGLIEMQNFDENFEATRPVVFISSYEHPSNELIWREHHAEVVKIGLTPEGHFDLSDLHKKVSNPKYNNRLKIGSFAAASSDTGVKSPIYKMAQIMHLFGGIIFIDYASAGPSSEINMTRSHRAHFDGLFLSAHKYLGGPGASGLLILRKALYDTDLPPTTLGRGSVSYMTWSSRKYSTDIEAREDGGTPGVIPLMRAALALDLKERVGSYVIENAEQVYIARAIKALEQEENIEILGDLNPENRLSILSFTVKHKEAYLHHNFVVALLNDLFGVQCSAVWLPFFR